MTPQDFQRTADKARALSFSELHYAILDCAKTAEAMDKIDREQGGDRAGYYRDEASVYRLEMARR
jgi:hypothetical protein